MMFAHRFRREDQNEVRGLPLDRWSPWYHFPSIKVGIRNAIFLALEHGWEVQLETGEVLRKHSREVRKMPLTKGGLVKEGKELPRRIDGSRDPFVPGNILVPLGRQHPHLRPVKGTPPNTFYRYNERKRRVECMVTMMPDGLMVAWDSCGQCAHHVRSCTCRAIQPSRSVLHIYEVQTGEPFEKPKQEERFPTFVPRKEIPRSKPPLVKPSLVKEKPRVLLTKDTSISDFDNAARRASKSKTNELLKTLQRVKRPPLTKG